MSEHVPAMKRLPTLAFWLVVAGFALAAVGSKWDLLRRFGSDVPYMDQWDAEATAVLQSWRQGRLDPWAAFWSPHNEHRIGWTRMWSLALTNANGQWDPWLIATLNALVHAMMGASILVFARRRLAGPAWWIFPLACAGLWWGTLAWENTIHPFQVQFYFLVGAAGLLLAGCATSPLATGRWWAGAAAGIFGLGTMSPSFLAPIALVLVRIVRAVQRRRWAIDDSATVALAICLAAIGIVNIAPMPGHAFLRAKDPGALLAALAHIGAFPAHFFWPCVFVAQAPLAWWIVSRARRFRAGWADGEWLFLGVVAWLGAQAMAFAYARGAFGHGISPRYADIEGLFLLVNAGALGALWLESGTKTRRGVVAVVSIAWAAVGASGVAWQWRSNLRGYLEPFPARWTRYASALRDFAVTGDAARFCSIPSGQLPHPNHRTMMQVLADPAMRPILPGGIRAPLALEPGSVEGFHAANPSALPTPPGEGKVWSSEGTGSARWVSAPMQVRDLLGVLRVRFAGDPRLEPRALRLVADDGRESPLVIAALAGGRWQTAHLFVPADATTVQFVAEAGPNGRWLAFAPPVELGFGSWVAHQARKSGSPLFWIGAGLFGAGLVLGSFPKRDLARSGESSTN